MVRQVLRKKSKKPLKVKNDKDPLAGDLSHLFDKKDNWVDAIKKNDLNWVHVSSLQGWSCPVAKLYNVSGVPAMLLIDKEGKIIATKLRGELLMEKVAEQFEE